MSDSYRIDVIDDLLRLRTWAVVDTPGGEMDTKRQLWFDMTSVDTLVNAITRFLAGPDECVVLISVGNDRIELFAGGPEDNPYVHLNNRRRKRAEFPGYKHCGMSRASAKALVEELLQLPVPEGLKQPA